MNILVEPLYIGFFQFVISLIIISGLIFLGRYINLLLFRKYQNALFDLIISLIILSQFLKIFTYLGVFKNIYLLLTYLLFIAGTYNLKNIYIYCKNFEYSIPKLKIEIFIIIILFLLFLISIAPPSMADALDYHYGIPLYLLNFNKIPSINFWLYANVGGNGDIFNSIALTLGTDNFVSFLQFLSLILFLLFLKKEIRNQSKFIFLSVFIISSPTILQLLSGPKFMILPQIMTGLALYLFIKCKKIETVDFLFIAILLMGASQFKSSFLISGSIIGLLTLFKAVKSINFKIFFYIFLLTSFFFLPTAIWNFNQVNDFELINIFSIMPDEMMNNMKQFKENNYVYPFNIFIPSSFGKISTVLGFQIFLLLLFFYKSENFKIIMYIMFSTILLHFYLGMNVGRMYYEYILWGSIAFIFIKNKNVNYNFYTKLILPQTILIFCFCIYFVSISISSLFSNNARNNFMINNTFYYEGIDWVNQNLPINAKIISTIRPVALLKNEFAPTDWLDFYSYENDLVKYFELIKKSKFDHILLVDNDKTHPLINCTGKLLNKSKKFKKSTRNPFNKKSYYSLSIHSFNYKMLPNCFNNNL